MKISKNITILMSAVCIGFLGLAIFLEFGSFENVTNVIFKRHLDFYKNLSLGILASGILVLIPSMVQYLTEKRRYYVDIYKLLNNILFEAIKIINCMVNYSQDGSVYMHFESFRSMYMELISEYSTFTYFFKLSKRDKFIESVIVETMRFIWMQEEVLKYSKQLKEGMIDEKQYKKCFETIKNEVVKSFSTEFETYRKMIDKETMGLVENRKLKKYF